MADNANVKKSTIGGRLYFLNHDIDNDSNGPWPGDITPSNDLEANLIGSLCEDGLHRPVLDVDHRARLVPSSTGGHFHLFFDDVALPWDRYLLLLDALAEAGILAHAYVRHCRERGMSLARREENKKRGAQ
jgi:hypothetical protein